MYTIMRLVLWTLVVLYPNVTELIVSSQRAWSPPVEAAAVQRLAATLPGDPRLIEAAVNSSLVPYAVPWQTYGVPWYFPTAAEVLAHGEGDCEARAVVLASLLRAKGIPATFAGSLDHLWIEYPGKHATPSENTQVALVTQVHDGGYRWHLPSLVDWQSSWTIERAYFWDMMPTRQRTLLLGGWFLFVLCGSIRRIALKRACGATAHHTRLLHVMTLMFAI